MPGPRILRAGTWNIHYGHLPTWDEVEKLLFDSAYPVQDTEFMMRIWRAGLDTGEGKNKFGGEYDVSMTERAYFRLRKYMVGRGCRVWGTKGSSNPLAGKVQLGKPLDKTPSGKPLPPIPGIGGLQLVLLNTDKLKDTFHYRLQLAIENKPGAAYLHSATDNQYVSHILAEEKRKNKRGADEWVQAEASERPVRLRVRKSRLADPEWPGGGINLIRSPLLIPKNHEQDRRPEPQDVNLYLGGHQNPFLRG